MATLLLDITSISDYGGVDMEILRLLDEFEAIIEECSRIPMTGKVVIHEDTLYNFFDRMRALMPETIREAEWVLRERDRILSEADKEAKTIVETAKSKLERIAGENEIVKLAKAQSDEIVENAKNVAKEITQGSFTYADEVMSNLQGQLEGYLQVVRNGREEIRKSVRDRNTQ